MIAGGGGDIVLSEQDTYTVERALVLSDLGKQSYDLGRKFLKAAGIAGELTSNRDACIRDDYSRVAFHGRNEMEVWADIVGGREQGQAYLSYSKHIGGEKMSRPRLPPVLQHAGIITLCDRLTQARGYEFSAPENQWGVELVVSHCVFPSHLGKFPDYVKHLDWLLSEYARSLTH